MSPEDKNHLHRMKRLVVRDNIPYDLRIAIESFMKQAVIIGEYELDSMPVEYMENLLKTLVKYPEHSILFMNMIDILERNEIIES